MKEEIYEGYDFLVMLMEKYRNHPGEELAVMTVNGKDLDVVEFGLRLNWLQHKRGQTNVMFPKFIWTEKAEREISHLDEWE